MAAYPIGNQAFADFRSSQNGTLNRENNAMMVFSEYPAKSTANIVQNLCATIPGFKHYGMLSSLVPYNKGAGQAMVSQEYYSSGTQDPCVKCQGERDDSCSAGNGKISIADGHHYNYGIHMGEVRCGV